MPDSPAWLPLEREPDWRALLGLAVHHRLAELLDLALQRTSTPAPQAVVQILSALRERTAGAEVAGREQMRELGEILARAGVKALALKGAALIETVYPELGVRPMVDLDLLVEAGRLDAAADALAAAGYRRHPILPPPAVVSDSSPLHHHRAPLIHPDRWFTVELHRAATIAGNRANGEPLLARAIPSAHGSYLLPDPSDHLVVLASHFTTDRGTGSRAALGQLADLAHTIERQQVDWDAVAHRANLWGLDAGVFIALYAICELGLAPVPDGTLTALRPVSWNPAVGDRLISERVLVTGGQTSLVAHRFPISARQFLFPGRAYMQARYNLPDAGLSRLYLERIRNGKKAIAPIVRDPRRALMDVRLERRIKQRSRARPRR